LDNPNTPPHLKTLVDSDDAMLVICEGDSIIRTKGNEAAHGPDEGVAIELFKVAYDGLIDIDDERRRGIDEMIAFIEQNRVLNPTVITRSH